MKFPKIIPLISFFFISLWPNFLLSQNTKTITPSNINGVASQISTEYGDLIDVTTTELEDFFIGHFTLPYDPSCDHPEGLEVVAMNSSSLSLEWTAGGSGGNNYYIQILNLGTGQMITDDTNAGNIQINVPDGLLLLTIQKGCSDNTRRSAARGIIIDKHVMLVEGRDCGCKSPKGVHSDTFPVENAVDIYDPWEPTSDVQRYQFLFDFNDDQEADADMVVEIYFDDIGTTPTPSSVRVNERKCMENAFVNDSHTGIYVFNPFENQNAGIITFGQDSDQPEGYEVPGFQYESMDGVDNPGIARILQCASRPSPKSTAENAIFLNLKERDISVTPNPTNNKTTIRYTVTSDDYISLSLYNNFGQKIKTLVNKEWTLRGIHQLEIDLSDHPSGMYNCVLESSKKTKHTKILRLE